MIQADPLLSAGLALQSQHRAGWVSLSAEQRREQLSRNAVRLARRLAASHRGYAKLYDGRGELTSDTIPPMDKSSLLADLDAFTAAAGVDAEGAAAFLSRPFELGSRYDTERVLFTSSGSTGERLLVPYHLTDLGRSLAAFHSRAVAAQRPQARRLLYIGLLDRHNGGNAWMHHLAAIMEVRMAHLFDDQDKLLALILAFRPDVILTRPHLLYELGQRAHAEGQRVPDAHLLSVGDPLLPGATEEIERLWGHRPHNSYSTVETGPLGYQQDPDQRALTVYDDLSLVELLDDSGRTVVEVGRPGRIAVTTVYRSHFPLVRYLVGDVAHWQDTALTTLSFPYGRVGVRLALALPGRAEPTVLEEAELTWPALDGVRDYQVRQTGPAALLVHYALSQASVAGEQQHLELALRHALADMLDAAGVPVGAVGLVMERVSAIAPDLGSGKVKRLVPLAATAGVPAGA